MTEQETNEIIDILLKDKKTAMKLFNVGEEKFKLKILDPIKDDIEKIKTKFNLECIFDNKDNFGKAGSSVYFFKTDWKYCITFEFSTDFDNLEVGIFLIKTDNLPSNEEKIKLFNEKLNIINLGAETKLNRWIWIRNLTKWNNLEWEEVISKSKDIFEDAVTQLMEVISKDESIMK